MSGSISYSSNTVPFLSANMPSGTFEDKLIEQGEELSTPGVDGRRWRTVHMQFTPFAMTTISDASTYAAAKALKTYAEQMVQKIVKVTCTIDGITYVMSKVHVSAVTCRLFPGPVFGEGASSGNAAHIEITWQMERVEG